MSEKKKENGDKKELKQVCAPYNFIPFSSNILEAEGEIPGHDTIDPALKTGEIHITMTADTPVFVSDGVKENEHFVKNAEGHYILPGSSVRGMIRSNMQILGFGSMQDQEDYEDYQIYFRDMTSGKGTTGKGLSEFYKAVLGVKRINKCSVPQNVKSGYLCKESGGYVIRPTKENYLRVSRKNEDVQWLDIQDAKVLDVYYTNSSDRVDWVGNSKRGDAKHGKLLVTGRPVGNKPNHLYIFPEMDMDEEAKIQVEEEDRISYQMDWEMRQNILGENRNFWKLPEGDEQKPVFYIRTNGHLYFGRTLFPRIGYMYPLSKGLPDEHKNFEAEGKTDFVRAIMGCADQEKSFRSRVFFEDLLIEKEPAEAKERKVALGGPKPSFYAGYVTEGKHYNEEDFQLRGYKLYWNKEIAEADVSESDKKEKKDEQKEDKFSTKFRPLPAEGKTVFKGVIHYRNLRPEELGLLLWAIRLEEGCYQNIGKAKPFGYGRMKLVIDELKEFDLRQLYTAKGLCGRKFAQNEDSVDRYIRIYDKYAAEKLGFKKTKAKIILKTDPGIRQFFIMKKIMPETEQFSYMELGDFKNIKGFLPAVSDIYDEFRKKAAEEKKAEKEKAEKEKAEKKKVAEAEKEKDSFEALAERFNKHRR